MTIMKRLVALLILAMAVGAASAQTTTTTETTPVEQEVSQPQTDWLATFYGVKIDGPMNVQFKKVEAVEESRIIYDTKGNTTSKFKFEIDKKGTLVVSEKNDPKRTTVTDVVIYYYTLRDVKISHAKAEFEGTLERKLFDLTVSGGAIVSLDVDMLDVAIDCTGSSQLTLKGKIKYLTMRASTAKVDCSRLSAVSATIVAATSSEVRVSVDERLEVTTSTGAKVLYKGHPAILRNHIVAFGGDIININ